MKVSKLASANLFPFKFETQKKTEQLIWTAWTRMLVYNFISRYKIKITYFKLLNLSKYFVKPNFNPHQRNKSFQTIWVHLCTTFIHYIQPCENGAETRKICVIKVLMFSMSKLLLITLTSRQNSAIYFTTTEPSIYIQFVFS